ncbi:Fic family protein [Alicyclobacillus sp.]|uniref:Fic family protein n=1 Tax=Alicyclobacillus sp. TaxID=61169 RepID=UPI0025C609CC|nr:Fic family protein [Alicyclobacillus sp.]
MSEAEARRAAYECPDDSGKDEQEVFNLMQALRQIETWEAKHAPITEERIQELHAIIRVIRGGRRPKRSEYRREQNQVGRRNQPGYYLPPEWQDVPQLMEDLVVWVNAPDQRDMVAPIKAGIFMYQFLTIHPYMDGNGRTARMLATYIMRQGGYGLKGLFVLERYYSRHLSTYYDRLQMGLHHNYYFGRNEADITAWLEFFLEGVAEVFQDAARIVRSKSEEYTSAEPELLRRLDPEQRAVFGFLALKQDFASTTELGRLLNLSDRTLRDRIRRWIADGLLVPRHEGSQRIRSITLAPKYQSLARMVQDDPARFRYLLVSFPDRRT